MPVLLEDATRRDAVRTRLRDGGVQTSVFYPAVHEFTAYRERFGAHLAAAHRVRRPRRDHAAAVPGHERGDAGPRRRRARGGAAMSWDDPAHRRGPRRGGPRGGRRVPALGLADDGPAHEGLRGGGRGATRGFAARRRGLQRHRRAAPRLRGARPRPGRRGDRPALHVPGDGERAALRRRDARPVRRRVPAGAERSTPRTSRRKLTPRTKAVIAVHMLGYPARSAELRALCDRARARADRGRRAGLRRRAARRRPTSPA